ncbi:MAG: competence/damage-inducible protein A [Candidatus Omnitrophica bacterium]|nr:competence/damage-inducible protein A [Candidatus Omnitrophota bacterium]
MIRAEILTIGAELLQGKTLNTNAQYLSKELTRLGFSVQFHSTCDDQVDQIIDTLQITFGRANLIIVTGGLGPTPDDVTRDAIAKFLGAPLVFHKAQYQYILHFFKKMGRRASPITQREAFFPKGGNPILNRVGIALGFSVKQGRQLLVVLPGVPRELESLFEHSVKKLIVRSFGSQKIGYELLVSLIGIDEARMMSRLSKRFFAQGSFEFGSYPMSGRILLQIRTQDLKLLQRLRAQLAKRFRLEIYSFLDEPLESVIGKILTAKHRTIAAAESCTGGLFSKRLTDLSGASSYFKGSVVSYSNMAKMELLSVSQDALKTYGAASKQVALQLAAGVRERLKSDFGISITGIAGPLGGTKTKKVGLVWIGFSSVKRNWAKKFQFAGNRDRIRTLASDRALLLLYQHLKTM